MARAESMPRAGSVERATSMPVGALIAASAIIFVTLGLRHSFGLFLPPVTRELGLGREVFGFAVAVQNLLWGFSQPIAGMIADKFGSGRVIFVGGLLYAGGLASAAFAAGPGSLYLSFGVLIGLGLSATSFAVVLGAVGQRVAPERRTRALAIASVGGSIGMFLSVPATVALLENATLAHVLFALAALAGVAAFMSIGLAGGGQPSVVSARDQSLKQALAEAVQHRGFLLLLSGFFVCGFQLAFIATHLPAYLVDRGLGANVGGTALAMIGFANIAGTFACGFLGDRFSKRKLLAILYVIRAASIVYFVYVPLSTFSLSVFALTMGLTWMSTVPLTSGIVAQVFGPRYLATLVGVVFLTHQTGSFLGAWLGGFVFDRVGSYEPVWWSAAVLALMAAAIHLPIDEQPIRRPGFLAQGIAAN